MINRVQLPARNNIGLLRLLFAALVIVGHAPELLDGDRSREPIAVWLPATSLGEIAVNGFFLLSGFLITRSFANSRSLVAFLERRVLRIYPAFVVSYLLCVFALGPAVGATPWTELPMTIVRLITLQYPMYYPGEFPGLRHYNLLNGAMWTIAYEFRCYLLTALLGTLLVRRPAVALLFAAASLLVGVLAGSGVCCSTFGGLGQFHGSEILFGRPSATVEFTSMYFCGTCFYLFWNYLSRVINGVTALASLLLAIALVRHGPSTAPAALATFGAVPIFWLALKADLGRLQRVNEDWDISYGVYLYGWPISITLIWLHPWASPWLVSSLSLAIALACGAASWLGVERWTKGKTWLSTPRARVDRAGDELDPAVAQSDSAATRS